jgi:hypothetical protein
MKFINDEYCNIDLNRIALKSDTGFMEKYLSNEKIFSAIEQENYIIEHPDRTYLDFLKRSFHMTKKLSPRINGVLDKCKTKIGFKGDINLYVANDSNYNAYTVKMNDKPILIEFTSGLINNFSDEELAFVIGHEIGHVLYSHYLYPLDRLLSAPHICDLVSLKERTEGYIWAKKAESTADRIGLLCCDNFKTAAGAFFKLSTGVSSDGFAYDVESLLEDFENFKNILESNCDNNDLYSLYPFIPLRIKILQLFAESKMYGEISQTNVCDLDDDRLNEETEKLLKLMEPKYLYDKDEQDRMINQFKLYAGYYLMTADGRIKDSEKSSLISMVGKVYYDEYSKEFEKIKNQELWQNKLYQIADKLEIFIKINEKHTIIRELSKIIFSDGDFDSKEKDAMDIICYALRLDVGFASSVLQEMSIVS